MTLQVESLRPENAIFRCLNGVDNEIIAVQSNIKNNRFFKIQSPIFTAKKTI